MFSDLLDMTLSYIQYITLLLRLEPEDVPSFFTEPFKVLRYVVIDTSDDVGETQRYNNYLRINLPAWLPLDIRLQYVCVAVVGPMVLTTLGMLFVYGKPAYIWFVCSLASLFMFLFGFILLANMKSFAVPGAVLPSATSLGILGGVGLPAFLLLLAGGLLGMGRARLRLLRQDAGETERLIDAEAQRRRDQRVTQQMVDREGIDLVAVAAQQVHAQRDKDAIEHLDCADVLLQGLFVVVLLIGGLVLLNAVEISAIADMQTSIVFKVIGALTMVVWACATFWWVMSFFKKGRQMLSTISSFASQRCLGLVVTVCNMLYINVVTNFISILYCVTLRCEAGTRAPFSASLFPSIFDLDNESTDVLANSSVGCTACNYQAFTQQCSVEWQRQLCAAEVQQRRLVYDPRVDCANIDAFFKVSGSLIFAVYLIFLPYLQFYMAQYAVQVLKESYPLEQRYYDVFTPEEIYFQKVLSSQNNAAFAYRAYKPQFRFYRLSFLLQKVILGVVGCVMREGLSHDVAWAGMIFFLVVPLLALSCSLYLQPFSRQVEAYYFVAVQAMVCVCAIVCLIAQQQRDAELPTAVWIVLLVLLVAVPVCTLVVGNAVTLREERRWTELWQQRLVESVTAAYEDPSQHVNPLRPPPPPPEKSATTAGTCATGLVEEPKDSVSGGSSPRMHSPAYDTREEDAEARDAARQQRRSTETTPTLSAQTESPRRSLLGAGGALNLPHVRRRRASYNNNNNNGGGGDGDAKEASLLMLPPVSNAASPAGAARHRRSSVSRGSGGDVLPTSSTSPASSPQNVQQQGGKRSRRQSTQEGDGEKNTDDPAPAATNTTAALANLRLLRALPGLLQAETWGDSMRLVLSMAGRTIAAPFTHFRQGGTVMGETAIACDAARVRSAGRDSASLDLAATRTGGRTSTTGAAAAENVEMAHGGSGLLRSTRRGHRPNNSDDDDAAEYNTTRPDITPLLTADPPFARTAVSPRAHRPIPGHLSNSSGDVHISFSSTNYSLPTAATTPSPRARSSSLPSTSISLSPRGTGLSVSNPLRAGRPHLSASLSPGASVASPAWHHITGSSAAHALTSPTCVVVPSARDLATPQPGGRRRSSVLGAPAGSPSSTSRGLSVPSLANPTNSSIGGGGGGGVSPSTNTASTTVVGLTWEDAGEYADDATVSFIPALYFSLRAPSRWQTRSDSTHAGGRSGSVRGRHGSGALHHTAYYGERELHRLGSSRRLSKGLTEELREVRLPWQPQQRDANDAGQEHAAEAHPLAVGEEQQQQDGEVVLDSTRRGSDSGVLSSIELSHPRSRTVRQRRSATSASSASRCCPSPRSLLRRPLTWIRVIDSDAARRQKYVLSFAEVYARRQLYQRLRAVALAEVENREARAVMMMATHNSVNGGIGVGLSEVDVLALTPGQRRHCAHKAFWGNPSDAMLGVVEVPGSMPPWGLYCHAPPPAALRVAPHTRERHVRDDEQRRSMYSLQRQYYSQLAQQQQQQQQRATLSASGTAKVSGAVKRGARRSGAANANTSLTTSPANTPLAPYTSFRFPLPMHPLRAAAYERQAAAVRAFCLEAAESQPLLPLDTELDAYAEAAAVHDADDDAQAGGGGDGAVAGTPVTAQSGASTREAGTLDWLHQWGPMLTELLYEAAMDNGRHAPGALTSDSVETSKLLEGSSKSSSRSSSSSGGSGGDSGEGSSTSSSSSASPQHRRRENDEQHADSHSSFKASTGWCLRWSSCLPWGKKEKRSTSSKKTRARQRAEDPTAVVSASPHSPLSQAARPGSRRGRSNGGGDAVSHTTSAAVSGATSTSGNETSHLLRRQHSMLLTLITGTHGRPRETGSRAPSVTAAAHHGKNTSSSSDSSSSSSDGSVSAVIVSPTTPWSANTNAAGWGDAAGGAAAQENPLAPPGLTAVEASAPQPAEAPAAGPQDPLIQQLRCFHLVRERLKESYWEHRDQLTAVQDYIDYEINETMRRVLTFLFIVVGVIATISFTLALLGMLHTLDWRFLSGVRRNDDTVFYELAGYESWDAFTSNCCCMAATDLDAKYPYYAIDVEDWVCANGITKERVRRDGYDGAPVDGYGVRALCGMDFSNGCSLTVDAATQTATLTGCDESSVSAAEMLRW